MVAKKRWKVVRFFLPQKSWANSPAESCCISHDEQVASAPTTEPIVVEDSGEALSACSEALRACVPVRARPGSTQEHCELFREATLGELVFRAACASCAWSCAGIASLMLRVWLQERSPGHAAGGFSLSD